MKDNIREKAITRTSTIGILANVVLAIFKAAAGMISGSIAIVLDAINSLTDVLSSVITILGLKLSRRRPDNKHPFGYGRIEYFSAVLVAMIVLTAGVTSAIESIKKIIHPELPDYTLVTIVIVVASVLVKIVLGRYVSAQGKKYNSDALSASGADASFDAIISASTLLGAVVAALFHISIDGILGVVISVFILRAGIELLLSSISDIMGNRPDGEITQEIKAAVRDIPQVQGAYDLVLHSYGPSSSMGSIHVEVSAELSAVEFHRLTMLIQQTIWEKFHVMLTVGVYAVDINNPVWQEIRQSIRDICEPLPGVLGTHGVYVGPGVDHEGVEHQYITFDVTVDFTVRDHAALNAQIAEDVRARHPGYTVEVSFDTNYSD